MLGTRVRRVHWVLVTHPGAARWQVCGFPADLVGYSRHVRWGTGDRGSSHSTFCAPASFYIKVLFGVLGLSRNQRNDLSKE